jgi:hypothetical protein
MLVVPRYGMVSSHIQPQGTHAIAKRFPCLGEIHRAFIDRQRVFFTASAGPNTRVNVSPRAADAFRVLDDRTVAYLDRTGSGNETAAHVRAGGRLTVMFCVFDGPPNILRLYGRGEVLHRDSQAFADVLRASFGGKTPLGTPQIIRVDVDLVQTSCGFGVPLFDFWASARRSTDGLRRKARPVSTRTGVRRT